MLTRNGNLAREIRESKQSYRIWKSEPTLGHGKLQADKDLLLHWANKHQYLYRADGRSVIATLSR
jgi:hypothetical protein